MTEVALCRVALWTTNHEKNRQTDRAERKIWGICPGARSLAMLTTTTTTAVQISGPGGGGRDDTGNLDRDAGFLERARVGLLARS